MRKYDSRIDLVYYKVTCRWLTLKNFTNTPVHHLFFKIRRSYLRFLVLAAKKYTKQKVVFECILNVCYSTGLYQIDTICGCITVALRFLQIDFLT